MPRIFPSARPVSFIATLGLLAAAGTAPALASDTPAVTIKPITIKVSDKAFPDATSVMCMPRTNVDKSRKSTLPKTMCHTQDQWTAMGVTFDIRKSK